MIKVVIIDDEKRARKILSSLLTDFIDGIEIVGEADSALAGKETILQTSPDLVFLDIEMPNGNGFTLLSSFDEINFETIFTTAYSEYAIKAIKFSALDYLLKPVVLEELKSAISKFIEKEKRKDHEKQDDIYYLPNNMTDLQHQNSKIVLPVPKGLKVISIIDIIYCKASGSYTEFHFDNKTKILVGKNLKYFEEKLSHFNLLRIHDSYMINLNHIDSYIRGRGGHVIMADGTKLDISRNKKDIFLKKIAAINP